MNAILARHIGILILLAILLMPLAACNQERQGELNGTVTMAGAPLPSGTVYFIDQSGKPWHSGIGADGSYRIEKIPVGPAKVKVVSHSRVPGGIANARGPDAPKHQKPEPPAVEIPKKYNNAEESGLIYEVKPGMQQYNIELTK